MMKEYLYVILGEAENPDKKYINTIADFDILLNFLMRSTDPHA
jgi:hypothetical protein